MNSSSSSELENDVFLPATIKPKLFSSGIGLFKRKRKSKNINDSKNMKDLLTTFPKQEPSLYSEVVKNKEELKFVIEGPIIAPKLKKKTQPSSENNYESSIDSLKSKSYPEESKKIISGVYKNNSLSKLDKNNEEIFKIDSLSPIVSPNLESINKLKEFYNLKYFTKYIAKDNYITRDLKEFEVGELHEFIDNTQLFFDKIYYLAPSVNYNFLSGISDKAGHYISKTHDHILYRYKITEVLGKGSYGTVIKCFDYKYKMNCA